MDAPRSFWSALWSQPTGPRSRLSRYTVANGFLYLAIGAALYLLPALLVPLWLLGMAAPGMVLPFSILDPLLGLGAYMIWRRERALRG